jgi:acyl dehydratase
METVVDEQAHARFAALSGDFNPMHMDAIAARRTQAGARVVHGVHSLLWLLERIAARHPSLPAASVIKVRFQTMVYIGDRTRSEVVSLTATRLRARLLVAGTEALSLVLDFGAPAPTVACVALEDVASAVPIRPVEPIDVPLETLQGRAGRLAWARPAAEWQPIFPQAVRYLGAQRIAALAGCSCLVGMVVPGLHSVFSGLDLALVASDQAADGLSFAVTDVDPRFRVARIAVHGGGLRGRVDGYSRPPPKIQASISSIAEAVRPDEFRGATALIVGGSRGLGEVTAKLIAAGGGNVIITYLTGQADAQAVASDINGWGGHCETMAYDARRPAAAQIEGLAVAPTHVYYFATPTIFRPKAGIFATERFNEFNAYYLSGLLDLVQTCSRLRPQGLSVFYPSTVYVENRPPDLTEYAMSKAAGEILCADLQQFMPGLRILAPRLPRAATDQTGSVVPIRIAEPVAVMAPLVRQMQSGSV